MLKLMYDKGHLEKTAEERPLRDVTGKRSMLYMKREPAVCNIVGLYPGHEQGKRRTDFLLFDILWHLQACQ